MKQKIKDFVYRMNNVSFAELVRVIPNATGQHTIFSDDNNSLVLWTGVSNEFAEAINHLLREGDVVMTTCDPLVYYLDRQILEELPIAKQRHRRFSKPHWLPVALCRP